MSANKSCKDCGASLEPTWWCFWEKAEYPCDSEGCDAKLCKDCHNKRPLLFVPPGNDANDFAKGVVKLYCNSCFQEKSTIDYTTTFTKIEGKSPDTIFVFVHGGGASRSLFHAHAVELKERRGYSSILLDLPGHASLVDTPLTLDSCTDTLKSVLKECGISPSSSEKIIYVGGSLGAYVGFHLLDQCKDIFNAAVLMDCGQNVGPGCGMAAKMGLVFMGLVVRNSSNAGMFNLMLGISKKSKADYKLVECCYGAGMFFDQGQAQIDLLKAVAPAEYIPKLNIPILFMNGSLDHRDSENKWLELCVNKSSELKVYDGGDHFFSHDTRFVEDILSRLDEFAQKV